MALTETCRNCLDELAGVISQLTDQEYSTPLIVLNNSSLGGHTRHVVEFYQCLLEQYSSGSVNYDLRRRNSQIENEVRFALDQISQIGEYLDNLPEDLELLLQGEFHSGGPVRIPTSLQRELVYQLEHTVHHMALIRAGLAHAYSHIEIPPLFGIAASTIRYKMQVSE